MDLGEFHALVASRRQHDLRLLDVISELDWQESGYRHLWQFLMHAMRITRAEAKRWEHHVDVLCSARAITGQVIPPRMPVARDAVAQGAVSLDQVTRIAAVVEEVPVEHADEVEAELTEWAYQFGPTELRKLGQRMVEVFNPDGDQPADTAEVEAQNTLDVTEHADGSLSGRFRFGVESAAVLQPLLSSLTAPQPGDHRTLTERQGDALAEIVRLAADSGTAPIEGGERPHIAVTVSLDTLQSGIGAATLDDGPTLTPEQTRRLACDAGIVPVVLGGKSQPIDVGETRRLADKRLRRALAIRDRGCAVPGCARTPHQCHAHHVQHWADGGPTTLDNMVLVCAFHHRLIHHAGWSVHMDQGLPVFTPPGWMRVAA